MKPIFACLVIVAAVLLGACGTEVTRMDPKEIRDLSGDWNDTDSRQVAETMVADALTFPWDDEFRDEHGRKPVVRFGRVRVRSDGEVINTEIFTNDLSRAFIKSGNVKVVSRQDDADVTRDELKEQDIHASADTRKEAFQETGADFVLHGTINVQHDQEGREAVKFYSTDLFLTNVQTREQVWQGNEKIKKFVETSRFQ